MKAPEENDPLWRACVECPAIWYGEVNCGVCAGQGEPIDQRADPLIVSMEEKCQFKNAKPMV